MKHKKLFLRIFAGIVVILFIMVIYNCVVRTDDDPQKLEKLEEEKAREAMYADTFDVVGDYLFPNQKVSNEDMALESDKDKKDEKASDDTKKKLEKSIVDDDDEIIESADISSDPTPAPPAPPAPQVEKMDKPTVTSVEN
ncbi:MAG: hypothetical protein J6T38_05900 [Bacteroidaceae bacterium]|nr:hypothetical protein [Bacteroidaceae bacterium]